MSNTFNLITNANDCYKEGSNFYDTNVTLYVANTQYTKAWIPFVLSDVHRGDTILQAILHIWAAAGHGWTAGKYIRFACEDADNPSKPTDSADLNGRTPTSAYNAYDLGSYSSGTEYTYDMTDAVQEVVNRSGWTKGNTLAVLIYPQSTTGLTLHDIHSYESLTHSYRPKLVMEVDSFVPRIGGLY